MNTVNENPPARLLPVGDSAWTVEFGTSIAPAIHARVLGLNDALAQARQDLGGGRGAENEALAAVIDVVPTFRSLTVHFDPLRCDGERLGEILLALARRAAPKMAEGRRWCLPVCFDDEFAPDLAELAAAKGLSREAVIEVLLGTEFRVYMIGFMPGFPYMGGLPEILHMPRLASPRKVVPERSLAVASEMCAVYPWESPGGWRLLGRTPVPMFSAAETQSPSLLASGDGVTWQAIDAAAYRELEAAAKAGRLDRSAFLLDSDGGVR